MSAKNMDKHNRWRNVTVAFRMSPEEDVQLEALVKLSGLTKQDYIISRVLGKDIIVMGNPRVYKALREQFAAVLSELRRLDVGDATRPELHENIRFMAEIMAGLNGGDSYGSR